MKSYHISMITLNGMRGCTTMDGKFYVVYTFVVFVFAVLFCVCVCVEGMHIQLCSGLSPDFALGGTWDTTWDARSQHLESKCPTWPYYL